MINRNMNEQWCDGYLLIAKRLNLFTDDNHQDCCILSVSAVGLILIGNILLKWGTCSKGTQPWSEYEKCDKPTDEFITIESTKEKGSYFTPQRQDKYGE